MIDSFKEITEVTVIENGLTYSVTYYPCTTCSDHFVEHSGGVKVQGEEEYYCPHCIKLNRHYFHIRDYCETLEEPAKCANMIIEDLQSV